MPTIFTHITKLIQTVGGSLSYLASTLIPPSVPQTVIFSAALALLLQQEGGYVNNPNDPGGPTKDGISLRYLKVEGYIEHDVNHDGKVDAQDIRDLTEEEIAKIYRMGFWEKNRIGELIYQRLANMYLSMSVNMGNKRATELMQRAVNKFYKRKPENQIPVNGISDAITIKTINSCLPLSLLKLYQIECEEFYEKLVEQHPSEQQFLKGWLNRVYAY